MNWVERLSRIGLQKQKLCELIGRDLVDAYQNLGDKWRKELRHVIGSNAYEWVEELADYERQEEAVWADQFYEVMLKNDD